MSNSDYTTHKRHYLTFRFPLSRYFELARKPHTEQTDFAVVAQTLCVAVEQAKEFIARVEKIRKFYLKREAEVTHAPKSHEEARSIAENHRGLYRAPTPGWVKDQIFKAQTNFHTETRDVLLTNVHLMRDLGIISADITNYLADILGRPANIDVYTASEFKDLSTSWMPNIGDKRIVELYQIVKAAGTDKKQWLDFDGHTVHATSCVALKDFKGMPKFSAPEIKSLFEQSASHELVGRGVVALRYGGLSNAAIQYALGYVRPDTIKSAEVAVAKL